MRRSITDAQICQSADKRQELISLARLIMFARHTAEDLGADFPTYLLDLAHGAIEDELQNVGRQADGRANAT